MTRHVAEITCLACGRDLGQIEKSNGALRHLPTQDSPTAAQALFKPGGGLVCGRCGGRGLIGPLERVFSYTTISAEADEARPIGQEAA